MKNIILAFMALFVGFTGFSQSEISRDNVTAKQKLEIKTGGVFTFNGSQITGISNDPTLTDSLPTHLLTEAAAKAYVDAVTGGFTASFVSGDSIFLVTPAGDTIFTGSAIAAVGGLVTEAALTDSIQILLDSIAALRDALDNIGATINQITLSASAETSMQLRYFGSGTPTLVKTGAGNFTLTLPDGVLPNSFKWSGNNTNLDGGNAINLLIVSVSENNEFFGLDIRAASSGNVVNYPALSVTVDQDVTVTGSAQAKITNLNAFGGSGFVILAKF